MEKLAGGGGARFRHQRSSDRFLGIFRPSKDSPEYSPPIELSEHDIFTTSSGASSRSDFKLKQNNPNPNSDRESTNRSRIRHNGIFAALNDNRESRTGSGSEARPVFNCKASLAISPVTSPSSRMAIPRRPPPPPDRVRLQRQSVPVNIPMMPAAVQRRVRDIDDADSEEEEEVNEGEIVPPHEVVASRHSPMLACSVLEGAGRTLKGRDLRQVRNAIWRKTGFID